MAKLEDAVVVVTGAGRGIGRAIAEELGGGGACVVANYAKSASAAEEVVAQMRANGARAMAVQADVSDPDQAARLIETAVAEFGRLDVLVNNAGITVDRTLKNLTIADWNVVVQTNLNGYFYTMKAALPHFMEQKHGKIIHISSFVGKSGNFGQANYAAAKAGVVGLTKTLAREWGPVNIQVNAAAFGLIATRLTAPKEDGESIEWQHDEIKLGIPARMREAAIHAIPMGRPGTPEEAAGVIFFLASPLANYVSGQVIEVTGGL